MCRQRQSCNGNWPYTSLAAATKATANWTTSARDRSRCCPFPCPLCIHRPETTPARQQRDNKPQLCAAAMCASSRPSHQRKKVGSIGGPVATATPLQLLAASPPGLLSMCDALFKPQPVLAAAHLPVEPTPLLPSDCSPDLFPALPCL